MQYRKLLAVGDSHGQIDMLKEAVEKSRFDPAQDMIIFLGDYIDRGKDPLACIDYVRGLRDKYPERVIALMGNHEDMMNEYIKQFGIDRWVADSDWLCNGGNVTLDQLKKLDADKRKEYVDFVSGLPVRHVMSFHYPDGKRGRFVFVHAGINPHRTLEEQSDFDMLWIRESFYEYYDGDDIIVVGHTPVQYIECDRTTPLVLGNIVMCDTGSYIVNGRISCVDLLSNDVFQSSVNKKMLRENCEGY